MWKPTSHASPAPPGEYHAEHATGLGKATSGVAYGKGGGVEVFRKSPEAGVRKEQMNKERQFFSHEGEVLKFVVVWDDPSPGGQQHEYKLCFYLSDSCAELCTSPQPGFDRFPHLLRRQPLPLNWDATTQRGAKQGSTRVRRWPTSKAPISVVFHSFWLIFGRVIISRNGLEAWTFFLERARAERPR